MLQDEAINYMSVTKDNITYHCDNLLKDMVFFKVIFEVCK